MAVGVHIIADFYGCPRELLSRAETLKRIFEESARYAGVTLIGARYHQFEPEGATGILLLAESHIAFHTWPEHGLVTLDVYTCGDPKEADNVYEFLIKALKPKRIKFIKLPRGDEIEDIALDFEGIIEAEVSMGADSETG